MEESGSTGKMPYEDVYGQIPGGPVVDTDGIAQQTTGDNFQPTTGHSPTAETDLHTSQTDNLQSLPESYSFKPIGIIKSCFKQKFGIPRQPLLAPSAEAELVLLPPFNSPDAVRGLDDWSHIWISFVFHRTMRPQLVDQVNTPPSLMVRPPRLGGATRIGVFASRATYRPNPLGLSVVRLLKVEPCSSGNVVLRLGGVDLLDGTPVIDIKPYLPYADCVGDATGSFAPAPPPTMGVTFTKHAEDQIAEEQRISGKHPRLQQLIREVVCQDPRPPARGDKPREHEYGMFLYDFNVRWNVDDDSNTATVVAVDRHCDVSDVSPQQQTSSSTLGPRSHRTAGKTRSVPKPQQRALDDVPVVTHDRDERKRLKRLAREAARSKADERKRFNREAQRKGDLRATGAEVPGSTTTAVAGSVTGARIHVHPVLSMEAFQRTIVLETDQLFCFNKPADFVCHPSKNGPMSSLVGAAREYSQLPVVHLVSRLDRETSGVVLVAKNAATSHVLQLAIEHRRVKKVYVAVLHGALTEATLVDQPLGKDSSSIAWIKEVVRQGDDTRSAQTEFIPVAHQNNFSLVVVRPVTGRKHQIRAHAEWLGFPIVGDKIYGDGTGCFPAKRW